ncbi:hypothetical protein HNY73_007080 [Argiope bruennichi]|uniref:Uncharacterized protein n=1 Tax=Argiope bruennichi TaxID=94029 RepID=A0A8T0FID4_ARGBR|nr:hypothetical protein HNY73_007080 [Argiope bruennichi]
MRRFGQGWDKRGKRKHQWWGQSGEQKCSVPKGGDWGGLAERALVQRWRYRRGGGPDERYKTGQEQEIWQEFRVDSNEEMREALSKEKGLAAKAGHGSVDKRKWQDSFRTFFLYKKKNPLLRLECGTLEWSGKFPPNADSNTKCWTML